MTGARRRSEQVVARVPARLLALGVVLNALGAILMLGFLWQWVRVADGPPSLLWLIGVTAAADFLGGILAMLAFGMVRS